MLSVFFIIYLFFLLYVLLFLFFFFFQAEDGIRDLYVTGVQTCALPISFDEKSYANGAAVGKSNAKPTENSTELSEAEVVVKNEGGVKIKVEPLEVEDIPKEMSGEETNMVGVERLEGKIVYAKRKPPSYLMDWKSIVDIQAIRSKEGEWTSRDGYNFYPIVLLSADVRF